MRSALCEHMAGGVGVGHSLLDRHCSIVSDDTCLSRPTDAYSTAANRGRSVPQLRYFAERNAWAAARQPIVGPSRITKNARSLVSRDLRFPF
jgi:hypothetical protein